MSSSGKRNNIYLIGFMGVGKSSVGPLAAKALGWAFVDLDREIEKSLRSEISEIFKQLGEKKFRHVESRLIRLFSKKSQIVVSLGGGAVLSKKNRAILKRSGTSIYLKANFTTLTRRIQKSRELRPLLMDVPRRNRSEKIKTIFKARKNYYESADLVVVTDKKTAASVAKQIARKISASRAKMLWSQSD